MQIMVNLKKPPQCGFKSERAFKKNLLALSELGNFNNLLLV